MTGTNETALIDFLVKSEGTALLRDLPTDLQHALPPRPHPRNAVNLSWDSSIEEHVVRLRTDILCRRLAA